MSDNAVQGVRPEGTSGVPATLTPTNPAPTGGEANATDPTKTGQNAANGNANASAADSKPPEIKDQDLESRLFSRNKPEETLESLRRDYAASSKEGIRLSKALSKIKEMLAEQQLDLAEEDGLPVGIIPAKGYSKDAKDFSLKLSDLSEEERNLFGDSPQKAVDLILSKAKKAFVRVAPTLESYTKPISQEREQSAIEFVRDMTEDGEKKHPNFEKNIAFIKKMLDSKAIPKGLKDAYHQSPEFVLELLSTKVDAERAALLALAAKETKKSSPNPPLGPASGASPVHSGAADADPRVKAMVEAMGSNSF